MMMIAYTLSLSTLYTKHKTYTIYCNNDNDIHNIDSNVILKYVFQYIKQRYLVFHCDTE